MSNLRRLSKYLTTTLSSKQNIEVAMPLLWDSFASEKVIKKTKKEFFVNPYEYLKDVIDNYYLSSADEAIDYNQSYQNIKNAPRNKGDWIKKSVIYSMMVRTSSAYDFDASGYLEDINKQGLKETGTFIKTLFILPYLKELGVDVLYLLPISKYSLKDKKGDLGSPYGVANFDKLNEKLSDPMVEEFLSIDEQFSALVEACHIIGIKVIIDIIPRTNSVNSDFILEHPEWFYWIKLEDLKDYKPPFAPGIPCGVSADSCYFNDLFASAEVKEHIKKFVINPKDLDNKKWDIVVKRAVDEKDKPILEIVQEVYGLTVAPAFSDCINDVQPAWSDVTYFRLYLDHPKNSRKYLMKLGDIAPYVLYDVAKASLNPGTIKNAELWDVLSNIIPNYQRKYGIDGARIDMGHALPAELIKMIIKNARDIDRNFAFIAEELENHRAFVAKKQGFNCIIGSGFKQLVRVYEGEFNRFFYASKDVDLPLFACVETHDTPRVVARYGEKNLAIMTTLFNNFIPNTIPFINSGQEFFELQPMNTGVDCRVDEHLVLPKRDPYHGRLALFDRYQLHYHQVDKKFFNKLKKVAKLRKRYAKSIFSLKSTTYLNFSSPSDLIAGVAYKTKKGYLLALANLDVYNIKTHYLNLENISINLDNYQFKQVFSSHNLALSEVVRVDNWVHLSFGSGEFKLIELNENKK